MFKYVFGNFMISCRIIPTSRKTNQMATSPIKEQQKEYLSARALPHLTVESKQGPIQFRSEMRQPTSIRTFTKEPSSLSIIYVGSILILLLTALSCMITLHRSAQILQESLELLEKQVQIQAIQAKSIENAETSSNDVEVMKFGRMINLPNECPPCPTEAPPNPISPHKNPVSVLNEEYPGAADYVVDQVCRNPPISISTLVLQEPEFAGKEWSGKGKSKANAKQAAAWAAIQSDFPHLIGEVDEQYKPPEYNPQCNDPIPPQ